ncbi:MAG: hypothetical protein Q8Q15_04535 [bacterium]|nr:hypothetical protein [bacterium]
MPTKDQPFTKKDFFAGLAEFFEKILAPYLEERFGNFEKRLDEHDKRFEKIDGQLGSMDRKLDLIVEKVTEHDVRLTRLEKRTLTS